MKRLIMTMTAAACALAACACASAQSPQKDWAGFGRYEAANSEMAGTPALIVLMGDSITDNWAKMDPDFFQGHSLTGRGISGQTTSEMLVRFRRDVLDLRPKAVVILAGVNDIARNNGPISLDNVLGNIMSMCELARANGIEPVLCSALPCDRLSWRPEISPAGQVRELNAKIRAYAEESGTAYVDYYSVMDNGSGGLDGTLSEDGCHPTMKGYGIMEPVLLEALSAYGGGNGQKIK